ncbi:MAG TPA: M20/M25/M40 family metallo-hydrolase [Acetobacteraceae bacterium]|nr:M20/M25/M40 family metallo-hydrolase [Acetobacteraceae bacterium]
MHAALAALPQVLARLDADRTGALERWFEVLRLPSISAQPEHAADCRAAAGWFRDRLAEIGFTAGLRETGGHPVVLAQHAGPAGATSGGVPHLLFYGHYDVQPAEPLERWTTAPFAPSLAEGPYGPRAIARGAVDDKGQVMTWLEAFRAWHQAGGGLPVRVTVLIEGEEETGSPNLDPFLAAHRGELAADLAVISDTNMWDVDTPAITTRLRGLVYAEITLRAAARDLHSGLYGGAARNPINALTQILGQLHDDDGRVGLPGFYDAVRALPEAVAAQWQGLGFDEAGFLGGAGLATAAGERGRPVLEQLWARPTADINGIWGGYTGPGAKTVIPAEAHAKLSFRLVPDQDPAAIEAALRRFVTERLPADTTAEIRILGASPGIAVSTDTGWARAAQAALVAEFGRPAVLAGSGGSIPVVESLRRLLGIDTLLMGFGLDDDQVHGPNEKFELRCFHHGARAHVRLLSGLAAAGKLRG